MNIISSKTLNGHDGMVISVFVTDEFIITTSDGDNTIKIWDITTGNIASTSNVNKSIKIKNLTIRYDEKLLVHDATTNEYLKTPMPYENNYFYENKLIGSGSEIMNIVDFNTHKSLIKLTGKSSDEGVRDQFISVFITDRYIVGGTANGIIQLHEYITHSQIFAALMCMWKLGYPNEIIHEIFRWLGIDTYA